MHRAFPSLSARFIRPISFFPQTALSFLPPHRYLAMAANGANGSDSRPVFFFDIDNCVRTKETYSVYLGY